jgi:sugar lactone lactonase YvrE
LTFTALGLALALAAPPAAAPASSLPPPELHEIATSPDQWTGIAISRAGRIFVSFPRWSEKVPMSVAELVDGKPVPFPDAAWNAWNGKGAPKGFACVQSVVVDDQDFLWVLDPANPRFQGVLPSGPVLYKFRLSDRALVATLRFPPEAWVPTSYLNDVRVDTRREVAYVSDSGAAAIVVIDLKAGTFRRLLDHAAVTRASRSALRVGTHVWKNTVNVDGIALDPSGDLLYFSALTGDDLYQVPTRALLDRTMTPQALLREVERVVRIGAADGMLFGRNGRLYFGGLETSSVEVLVPPDRVETVVRDPRIRWADSFAQDAAGNLYFTTSQIHLPPAERGPYAVYRIDAASLR